MFWRPYPSSPWWDDAAQCQAFDLIRGLIEILVPFSSMYSATTTSRCRRPSTRSRSRLKGPKTPMRGRLRENRQEYGASDVRGGVVDPEAPCSRQAKFLPI